MLRRTVLKGLAPVLRRAVWARRDCRGKSLKIGFSLPLTGAGFTAVGRKLTGRAQALHPAARRHRCRSQIEIIIRDDGGVADNARRLVQEMIVNEKVDFSASESRRPRSPSPRS